MEEAGCGDTPGGSETERPPCSSASVIVCRETALLRLRASKEMHDNGAVSVDAKRKGEANDAIFRCLVHGIHVLARPEDGLSALLKVVQAEPFLLSWRAPVRWG